MRWLRDLNTADVLSSAAPFMPAVSDSAEVVLVEKTSWPNDLTDGLTAGSNLVASPGLFSEDRFLTENLRLIIKIVRIRI